MTDPACCGKHFAETLERMLRITKNGDVLMDLRAANPDLFRQVQSQFMSEQAGKSACE